MDRAMRACLVFTVDDKLRIASWNRGLEEICKKAGSEIKGRPYHELIPRMDKNGKDAIKLVLKNGKPMILKGLQLPCLYGNMDSDIEITPLKTGAKITAETCLNCNLLKGINQTQKSKEINSTAATLAHGVRNPLNAIKGSVVYIREKYAGEKHLIQFIKIIEEEIARLDAFIAHYLSTSVSQKSIDSIDINSVLKKIEILTSLQVQSRKLKAVYEHGSIHPVKINPFHLEQAILNVINNAIEAMSPGGQLTISTKSISRSGTRFALVEISDTGGGIAKDIPDVISSQNKGRGFGLFITHEILRSVGGHLEIKSERGTGTIVRLYFPCS